MWRESEFHSVSIDELLLISEEMIMDQNLEGSLRILISVGSLLRNSISMPWEEEKGLSILLSKQLKLGIFREDSLKLWKM